MTNHRKLLSNYKPCREAADWYNGQDSEEAWLACSRGDWLLWAAGKLNVDRKLLVAAACDCAELAIPFAGKAKPVAEKTLAVTRLWLEGKATREEVRAAANAAYAAYAAATNAAADAAYAAAYAAANAADAAANAANAAANAANAASAETFDIYADKLLDLIREEL